VAEPVVIPDVPDAWAIAASWHIEGAHRLYGPFPTEDDAIEWALLNLECDAFEQVGLHAPDNGRRPGDG
jgi:hypothetical protein